jgi:hypothetical protein
MVNMVKVPMIMHHITLCTPCIALVDGGHLLHMRVDHTETEAEVQKGASLRSVQRSTSIKW